MMSPFSSLATWPDTNTKSPAFVAGENGNVRVPALLSSKNSIVIRRLSRRRIHRFCARRKNVKAGRSRFLIIPVGTVIILHQFGRRRQPDPSSDGHTFGDKEGVDSPHKLGILWTA